MHEKEAQAQLSQRLADASVKVSIGARYEHYKKLTYKVLTIALREEDHEPCVIYQAEYGDRVVWVRPVVNWRDEVEVDGKKVQRFTKL